MASDLSNVHTSDKWYNQMVTIVARDHSFHIPYASLIHCLKLKKRNINFAFDFAMSLHFALFSKNENNDVDVREMLVVFSFVRFF